MFFSKIKKKNVFACKLQFHCIKEGFKGVKIKKVCFHDDSLPTTELSEQWWQKIYHITVAPREDSDHATYQGSPVRDFCQSEEILARLSKNDQTAKMCRLIKVCQGIPVT